MRVVQVRVSRAAFAETMGAMRAWLDRPNRPLVGFDTASEGQTNYPNDPLRRGCLGAAFRDDFGGADRAFRNPGVDFGPKSGSKREDGGSPCFILVD